MGYFRILAGKNSLGIEMEAAWVRLVNDSRVFYVGNIALIF